jgi:DNA-binding transcriptional LysR family regulator
MDLHRVDLNLLVAFEALLAERSVTKAAERMSVGQSAMSSTLGRLRKLLDDPVLVREGRGVVATPLAESLVDPIREVLTDIEHVLSRKRTFDPARDERTFSVVVTDQLATTVLHPLLVQFATEAPGVRFRLDASHDRYRERLARHEVDLVIVPREAVDQPNADFLQQELYSDRYVVGADRDHPEIGDSISIEQFSQLPYLATFAGERKTVAEMQLDWLGVERNVALTASLAAAPYLLRGTRLITLMLERVAREIADRANLKILEPPVHGLRAITEVMVWAKRTDFDPAHIWLRERLGSLAHDPTASV